MYPRDNDGQYCLTVRVRLDSDDTGNMSFGGFGISVGDIIGVGSLAWNIYKACKSSASKSILKSMLLTISKGKSASAEFEEVAREVNTLHTAIKELGDEAHDGGSILNRTDGSKKTELEEIVRNCRSVLVELEKILTKYNSLGTKSKRTWDRIRFGAEGLQAIREKLTFHTSSINLFLTTLSNGSLGRIEKKLDEIMDEIRGGRREPTILAAANDDNEEDSEISWNILKIELLDEGFTRQELEGHKLNLMAHLRELIEKGKKQENSASTDSPIAAAIHSSPAINNKTVDRNAKSQECAFRSRDSPSFTCQEQEYATPLQNPLSHSFSLKFPSEVCDEEGSERCGVELQTLDATQMNCFSTKEGTTFSMKMDHRHSSRI